MSISKLSLASVLEKNKVSSDVPFIALVKLDVINPITRVIQEVVRVANNPDTIGVAGELYAAGAFDFELKSEGGKAPEVALTVVDYTQEIQQRLQAWGGLVGSKVTLMIVRGNALNDPPEIVEFFEVVGASATNFVITLSLGAENGLMQSFPRRTQRRDFCQWRYRDPTTCRYVGPLASCDLTLQGANGCSAHNNTIHFGAYPGLNNNGVRYY